MIGRIRLCLDGLLFFLRDAIRIVSIQCLRSKVPRPDLRINVIWNQRSGTKAISSSQLAEDHLLLLRTSATFWLFWISQIVDLAEELSVLL